MRHETAESIHEWQTETFGPAPNIMRSACRANEEMAELLSDLSLGHYAKAGEEIADIILCLHGVTAALGINIAYEVDRKMEINRKRKWRISDQGHGYHVKD